MMFWFVLSLVCAIRLQNVVWGDIKIIIADNIITELRTPPPKKNTCMPFYWGMDTITYYCTILLYFSSLKKIQCRLEWGQTLNHEPQREISRRMQFFICLLVFSILLYLCLSPLLFYLFGVIAVSKHKYRVSEKHLRAENIK